jgi:hypothetical protein
MCFSKPSIPTPAPAQKPQEAKMPEQAPSGFDPSTEEARKRAAQAGGTSNTLLTGPSGVENNQLALGRSTLLGM